MLLSESINDTHLLKSQFSPYKTKFTLPATEQVITNVSASQMPSPRQNSQSSFIKFDYEITIVTGIVGPCPVSRSTYVWIRDLQRDTGPNDVQLSV